jgi:hypothetical protein
MNQLEIDAEVMAKPINAQEVLTEGTTGAGNAISALSLDEMRQNTEKAKKEFEALEGRQNKLRSQKMQAVEAYDRERVLSLSKEDAELSLKLDAAYSIWQNAKLNFESALKNSESIIVAEGLFQDYTKTSVDVRAGKGNIFLNHVRQLNDLISLISDMSAEFEGVQTNGMGDMEKLCGELKRMNIYRLKDADGKTVELPVIREDAYGSIKPIRDDLGREAAFLENGLPIIEKVITKIRKSCNFHLLVRGD